MAKPQVHFSFLVKFSVEKYISKVKIRKLWNWNTIVMHL